MVSMNRREVLFRVGGLLLALPATAFCTACQAAHEQQGRLPRH